MSLFNEIEPFAAAWLRTMYGDSHVDTRSIADLNAADVAGFRRVHFFAGIGGWEEALRIAGWPEEREIWTGSCPCQPFSVAGKRGGTDDERHLWPEFFRLVKACRPRWAMGEQVSSKDGLAWLDGVFDDLEAEGYTCWAVDTCAAGVGAPHIRQRLYWVAYSTSERLERTAGKIVQGRGNRPAWSSPTHRLEHAPSDGREQGRAEPNGRSVASGCGIGGMGDASSEGPQERQDSGRGAVDLQRQAAQRNGPWSNAAIIHCRDGKLRPISPESGDEPLAYGIPLKAGHIVARLGELGIDSKTARRIIANARRNRTGRLRGYGNAIVPQVAVEFIRSFMEAPCN